jgi:hypothetical protein
MNDFPEDLKPSKGANLGATEAGEPEERISESLDAFTKSLKNLFDQTLAEPIPDSFNELLDKLDEKWEGDE